MKIKIIGIFLIIIMGISLIAVKQGHAGSFYNSRGLGEIRYFASAQAIGMGGSLIAVPDQFQINVLNPAGLVFIPLTRLSGDFLHEAIWTKTDSENGFTKYTNLNGISLAVPLKVEKLAASVNIIPSSQFDYEYSVMDSIDNYGYSKKIKASGGLNKISFGFGIALSKHIYLGNYFHVNFGKLEQTWKVDYVSDLFWDSNSSVTRKLWGINWTGGIIVRPIPNFYAGAIYSSKYKLNYNDETENFTQKSSSFYLVDNFKTENLKTDMPELWGLGLTYVLKEKYRFSSDFLYQAWTKFKNENDHLVSYNDSYNVGFGVEMLPSTNMLAKYHEKMSYRAGYFFRQLNFEDGTGNLVTENGISIGFGFPYYGTGGRLDVALRYGKRGDLASNPVKEDIFQIFISVAGGEKWFFRGN